MDVKKSNAASLREGAICDHHYDPLGGCDGTYDKVGVCGTCGRPPITVRVRTTAKSTLRGQTLRVVRVEPQRRRRPPRLTYLCEMPGWPQAGWFDETESDRG